MKHRRCHTKSMHVSAYGPHVSTKKGHTMKAPATTTVLRHLRPGSPKARPLRVVVDVRERGDEGMGPTDDRNHLRCAVYQDHS